MPRRRERTRMRIIEPSRSGSETEDLGWRGGSSARSDGRRSRTLGVLAAEFTGRGRHGTRAGPGAARHRHAIIKIFTEFFTKAV